MSSEPTAKEMQQAATRVAEEEDARDAVLAHYHAIQKDLILRHKGAGYPEMRALAAQLTVAAVTHYHAVQTARLADVAEEERKAMVDLRNNFSAGYAGG